MKVEYWALTSVSLRANRTSVSEPMHERSQSACRPWMGFRTIVEESPRIIEGTSKGHLTKRIVKNVIFDIFFWSKNVII